ncbi:hypothetical protein ABZY57_04440 [Streptomyces sp. NPDC006450]|uniref:hypothetical protein n=1 Tax=Streptomyces sp. NPDC006450 TaxID=3155458 RepID=UPI0033B75246
MPTMVVGFRLGKAATSRQVTVLFTESGVLHRSHGVYGQPPKLDAPKLPLRYLHPGLPWIQGEQVLTGPISALRGHHATALKNGYDEVLIPPACVRLDVAERPLPPREDPRAPAHLELTEAFLGSAPHIAQPLDRAVDAFRTALGLPVRMRDVTWRPRQTPVPPRIEAMLRTLAHGSEITSPGRAPVGWNVRPEAVTLRAGRTAQSLDRQDVLELQAALTAWLRLTQPPPS